MELTSPSIVYVMTKGFPSKLWNAKALPANTNDPALNGDPVNCFITEATSIGDSNSPHLT